MDYARRICKHEIRLSHSCDDDIIDLLLNGLFALARTIGIVGHVIDQKLHKQPLYRHPWDDITFGTDLD